jgi:hypothetical protein
MTIPCRSRLRELKSLVRVLSQMKLWSPRTPSSTTT